MQFFKRKDKAATAVLQAELKAYTEARARLDDLDTKAREYIEKRAGIPISMLSDYEGYIETYTGAVWATYRACDLTAATIAQAEFFVRDKVSKKPIIESKGLSALLEQPNPFDSWEELVYFTGLNLKLTGNAYWLKDGPVNRPSALYPLLTANMKITPDAKTKIKQYEYSVNGAIVKYKPEEIIHFRKPHPADFVLGIGDVEGASKLMDSYINRGALEEKFLTNGAQPSGVMTRKGEDITDPAQWKAFKDKFNAEYAGRSNAGKIAFINGEWEFLRVGLTQQEMQSMEKERWAIAQIFAAHGVPLSVAGLEAAANYATARVEDMNFRRYTCVSLLKLISGKINAAGGLAMGFGDKNELVFNLSGLLDVKQVVEEYKPLVELGAMTLNELREKAGLEKSPDPTLDGYYVNQTRIPLELAGMSSLQDSNAPADPNDAGNDISGNPGDPPDLQA